MLLDPNSFMTMSSEQIAEQMMAKHPDINPAVLNAPPPTATTNAMDMLPAPGEHFMGANGPQGGPVAPGAAGPGIPLAAAASALQPKPMAPAPPPLHPMPGGQPANPGTYPAAGPIRARSASLGQILGGLK